MISEEKFYEKAKDFALVKNTKGEYYNLEEYKAKVKDQQTDKSGTLVYLYSNDAARQDSFIQSANRKSYDVLLMDGQLDTHFISQLEQKGEKLALKRVDADVITKLIEKDENYEDVLTEEQRTKVKDVFTKAINKPNMQVELEAHSPDELPVTVTMDEFMRRMKDMSKMGGPYSFYGAMPDNYKVAVNSNHKLVSKILEAGDEDQQTKLAKQAYDLALLSQGMLTGSDLTEFVNRSVSLI